MWGTYIGVDEYPSKLAVLHERFEGSSAAGVAASPNLGADSTLAADEAPIVEARGERSVWSNTLS